MKISVVIPTWQRHHLLLNRALPSVLAQTVPVECIVASDGPDPELQAIMEMSSQLPIVYVEVAEHHVHETNVGGWARNRGLEVATGDLIAYLDDDNAFRPDHIKLLAEQMEAEPAADFVYSQMIRHGYNDQVGSVPPAYGTIDSSIIMHRANTHLKFGRWPEPSLYWIDWELINSWLNQGACYTHLPVVTVDYYVKGT